VAVKFYCAELTLKVDKSNKTFRSKIKTHRYSTNLQYMIRKRKASDEVSVTREPNITRKKKKIEEKKASWWNHRSSEITRELSIPSTNIVDDMGISWASRCELHNAVDYVHVETNRKKPELKVRKHTTGMSKKKLADDEIIRSRKIRVRPTRAQKHIFHNHWVNTYRYARNSAKRFSEEHNMYGSKEQFRDYILKPEYNPEGPDCGFLFHTNREWIKEYGKIKHPHSLPRDGKAAAVFEHFGAVASSNESLQAKRDKGHSVLAKAEIKYKTRDDATQHVTIYVNGGKPSVNWDNSGFTFWKTTAFGVLKPCRKQEMKKLTERNGDIKECKMSCTLKYERPGRYYMIIPIVVKKKQTHQEATDVIAFDPGVRTFQVGFDNSGRIVEYGKSNDDTTKGGVFQIYKLGLAMDRLHSKIDTHSKVAYEKKKEREQYKNRRKKMRRRCGQLAYRISNLKRDLHWKMAKEITNTYTDVLISRFPVSQMIKKEERKIKKVTVKKMLNWSHFHFRQRLIHKAEEQGSIIHEVSEHYTSKCCGRCGNIHWNLGGNKVFQCPTCHFTIDRDHNAAKNIMTMNIEEYVGKIIPRQRTEWINPRSSDLGLGYPDSNHVPRDR